MHDRPPVRWRVLGDLVAFAPGARPIGGPTQRRSLGVLIAHRNETVIVDQIVDACWPAGDAPPRAEHNVRTYIHRLRGALGALEDRLTTSAGGYRLRIEPDELDIDRYLALAREVDRLITTGDATAALDRIDEAEALWLGRPYAELADETWSIAETSRLVQGRRALASAHVEALVAAGRPTDAIGALDSVILDQPFAERPRALLMRALYESGRQAEALRAFQDFRRSLIEDAGVEPSPDLVDLDRRIATSTLEMSATVRTVGNCELHERIGEGAFAVVHRATQLTLGRDVAVKIVRAELANRPEFIRRFEAEAQMVASIEHPSVVPLYDYWREPGHAFLVMRWMTGGSLETRLDDGPLDVDAVVEVVDQVAAALDAAHAHDIVHRDVKPANIMFDDGGRAFLGDFGIALAAEERSTPQAALSEGSPVFASPEQLRREPAGPEADVHALGIVAFTALTGRTPFEDAGDAAELLRRQLDEPVPPVSIARPGLPVELDEVIAIATAKRPTERYPTAGGFAAAFRSAASGAEAETRAPRFDRVNPYRGLRAFSEADAALFHGRARIVDELLDACVDPDRRLLTVVGASGSGKSSVIRAGLVPALRAGRVPGSASWFVTTMVPGAHPYEALETALLRVAVNPPVALLGQLTDGDRGIHRAVRRIVPDDGGTVLLVVDQFEELFTATDETTRRRFLRALASASTEPGGPLRVVATMRADFFDRPLRHPEYAQLFTASTVAVTPLAPDELEEAITAPAAAVGVAFEPGLVAEVVADVNTQPGALPLLQYALTQLFDATDGDTICAASYHQIGGLAGALGQRAESLHAALTDEEQAAARRLFGRLVTLGEGTEDTRRRVRRSELPGDSATDRVVERFGSARLLTFDREPATREPTVEIAHEAMIREWPRLRSWLDDDRDDLRVRRHLTAASAGWVERERDPNELYRGARLDAAECLSTSATVDLNATETEFLRAGIDRRDAERTAERRRIRRLRGLVVATAVVAAIALLAGAVAVVQWRRADRRSAESEAARSAADHERLRATSAAVAQRDIVVGALLAAEAYRIDPSHRSESAIHQILADTGGLMASMPGRGLDLWLRDDGVTAITRNLDGLEVWDLDTRSTPRAIPFPVISDAVADVARATGLAAVGTLDGELDLIDTGSGATLFTSPVSTDEVAFSPDGTMLAVSGDGLIEIWDVSDPTDPAVVSTRPGAAGHIGWHPTSSGFVTIDFGGAVEYWTVGAGVPEWTKVSPFEDSGLHNDKASLFHPDGDTFVLAFGPEQGLDHIWTLSVEDGSDVADPYTPSAPIQDLWWLDEEALVVGAAVNVSGLTTIDLPTGVELDPVVSAPDAWAVEWSEPLDRLVTAGTTGIQLWSLDGAGPLVQVFPVTREQEAARAGSVPHTNATVYDDGRRLLTGNMSWPPVPNVSYDLADPNPDPTPSDVVGPVVGEDGALLRVGAELVLLDQQLEPYSTPVPAPPGMRWAAPSPDGTMIAVHSETGGVDVYGTDGELVGNFVMSHAVPVTTFTDASFSGDGTRLVTYLVGGNGAWAIWDLTTGKVTHEGDGTELVRPWLENGTLYAEASDVDASFAILRLDPDTLEEIAPPLVGHTGPRGWVDDDGRGVLVVTGGFDQTRRVWDAVTGEQIGREIVADGPVFFLPDGTTLLTVHPNHTSLWDFDTASWVERACEFAGRNLTREEWDEFGPEWIEHRATCPQFPLDPAGA